MSRLRSRKNGCPTGAKATVMNTYLSLGLWRVDLLSEATVSKVLFQDSSVTGVELIEREEARIHFCKVALTVGYWYNLDFTKFSEDFLTK